MRREQRKLGWLQRGEGGTILAGSQQEYRSRIDERKEKAPEDDNGENEAAQQRAQSPTEPPLIICVRVCGSDKSCLEASRQAGADVHVPTRHPDISR